MRIDASFRYGVIGVYKSREDRTILVYPIPFLRFSFNY